MLLAVLPRDIASGLRPGAVLGFLLLLGLPTGCSSSSSSPSSSLPCVTGLSTTCAPLYAPTFANVYAQTLHPTCAQPGASCHSSDGKMGGLSFEDQGTSYALLLGQAGGSAFVLPGNPACSPLIERLSSAEASVQMPPGDPLSDPERCAIVQWVANGATP